MYSNVIFALIETREFASPSEHRLKINITLNLNTQQERLPHDDPHAGGERRGEVVDGEPPLRRPSGRHLRHALRDEEHGGVRPHRGLRRDRRQGPLTR